MRPQESIHIATACLIATLAFLCPLGSRRRIRVVFLAAAAAGSILGARFLLSGSASRIVRDWLPAALLLFPYWQAGLFFLGPNTQIQNRLLASDQRLFTRFPGLMEMQDSFWTKYFELAYFVCYPIIPLGFAVLVCAQHAAAKNSYWTAVLLASDVSFVSTIFVPALPPRLLDADLAGRSIPRTNLRSVNLAVLSRGSIRAITFPSAHVASTMAAAILLLHVVPLWGAGFLLIALSIALGAFLGRYHYAWDVVAAALLAGIASLATQLLA
jgi:hypothetical protein